MANRIIFSIHVDIPEDKLDKPAGYIRETGEKKKSDKSLKVKNQFLLYKDKLVESHISYAERIECDYVLHEYDEQYEEFCEMFRVDYPQISEYDIINFYKHWLMKYYSTQYDDICYLDFDVVPNTEEDIFDNHDPTKFACAHQNKYATWGKIIKPEEYNTCIRNPATKYWNAHAMLLEEGYEPDTDVFNTAIMVASKEQIEKLDYFGNFNGVLDLMSELKEDSIYPFQIQRVFGYDNETVFAFKRVVNKVEIDYIDELWHNRLDKISIMTIDPNAKMYHVIHKRFDLLL